MVLNGKNVAVLGLGVEGRDLVNYLTKENAKVTVLDKKPKEELDLDGIGNNVSIESGSNYLENLSTFDIVFRSPGVYRYLPEIVEAEKNGVTITSATKLFFNLCPAKIIGVTGTKGKGTTSTLIYQILRNSGKDVYLAGNIGTPLLEILPKLSKSSIVVLELSSFQLIDLDKSPNIAVILNITSDHMDWHRSVDEYVHAKENIVKFQRKEDFAVINSDYVVPKSFSEKTKAQIYFYSKSEYLKKGAYVENDDLVFNDGTEKSVFGKKYRLLLKGEHNLENVLPAIVVAKIFGIKNALIEKTITEFRGLEHRLELVDNIGGVTFYNDSFATGPQPTIAAIQAFEGPTTLILGGSEKFLNYDGLAKAISKSRNVKTVVLIGQIAEKIKASISKTSYKGKILELGISQMQKIVQESFKVTPKGGVVLLSPAAASFDMFKNYKDRGNQFKEAVAKIKNG